MADPTPPKQKTIMVVVPVLIIAYAALNLLVGVNGAFRNRFDNEPMFENRKEASSHDLATLAVKPMTSPLSIVVHALILVGGILMASGHRDPLTLIASILLLVPCSTIFCVGIPLGIVSLAIVRNPRSVGAFTDEIPIDTSTRPCPTCGRINSIHTKVCPKCDARIIE